MDSIYKHFLNKEQAISQLIKLLDNFLILVNQQILIMHYSKDQYKILEFTKE